MSNDLNGTYRAIAVQWEMGETSTGKEQIAIRFKILGDEDGRHITYFGFFTEKTAKRTMESMRICGWQNDDFVDVIGLDSNEVELVIAPEEYNGTWTSKVKWVNRPGGGLKLEKPMDDAAKRAFSARMKSLAVESRVNTPKPAAAKPTTHGLGVDIKNSGDVPF